MSESQGFKRDADPGQYNNDIGSGGGGGGGGSGGCGGGGGDLFGITAVEKVFHFLDGPVDVLSASTACRRWRELACAGSVWRVKVEREDILDKAAAFEVEVPEDGLLEKEETAAMAFYARVFALKVRGSLHLSTVAAGGLVSRPSHHRSHLPPSRPPPCRVTR